MISAGSFLPMLLTLLAACGGGNEPSDGCESVALTVTIRASGPVFDWSSACPAGALDVAPFDNPDAFTWIVLANPGQNTIRGPVTYGVAPAGTGVTSPLPADPLVSGRNYRVHIWRTVGPADFGLALVGEVDFTAP